MFCDVCTKFNTKNSLHQIEDFFCLEDCIKIAWFYESSDIF